MNNKKPNNKKPNNKKPNVKKPNNKQIIEKRIITKIINKATTLNYYDTDNLNSIVYNNGVSMWQGIRTMINDDTNYLISGTSNPSPAKGVATLYEGNISLTDIINIFTILPSGYEYSSGYGTDQDNTYTYLVGTGQPNGSTSNLGFLFKANTLSDLLNYVTTQSSDPIPKAIKPNFYYPNINLTCDYVYCHSISNGMMVGNGLIVTGNGSDTLTSVTAFIYNTDIYDINNILTSSVIVKYPNSVITSVYTILYNGNNSYTIAGGYGMDDNLSLTDLYKDGSPVPYFRGFIADFDSSTKVFSNWLTISTKNLFELTHIQGITHLPNGNYGASVDVFSSRLKKTHGYFVEINRSNNKIQNWIELKYSNGSYTTANSVANYNVVGKTVIPNDKSFTSQTSISFISGSNSSPLVTNGISN